MRRAEFTGVFLGLMVQRIPTWLPEESTEENMLDIMLERIVEHKKIIKETLQRSGTNEQP